MQLSVLIKVSPYLNLRSLRAVLSVSRDCYALKENDEIKAALRYYQVKSTLYRIVMELPSQFCEYCCKLVTAHSSVDGTESTVFPKYIDFVANADKCQHVIYTQSNKWIDRICSKKRTIWLYPGNKIIVQHGGGCGGTTTYFLSHFCDVVSLSAHVINKKNAHGIFVSDIYNLVYRIIIGEETIIPLEGLSKRQVIVRDQQIVYLTPYDTDLSQIVKRDEYFDLYLTSDGHFHYQDRNLHREGVVDYCIVYSVCRKPHNIEGVRAIWFLTKNQEGTFLTYLTIGAHPTARLEYTIAVPQTSHRLFEKNYPIHLQLQIDNLQPHIYVGTTDGLLLHIGLYNCTHGKVPHYHTDAYIGSHHGNYFRPNIIVGHKASIIKVGWVVKKMFNMDHQVNFTVMDDLGPVVDQICYETPPHILEKYIEFHQQLRSEPSVVNHGQKRELIKRHLNSFSNHLTCHIVSLGPMIPKIHAYSCAPCEHDNRKTYGIVTKFFQYLYEGVLYDISKIKPNRDISWKYHKRDGTFHAFLDPDCETRTSLLNVKINRENNILYGIYCLRAFRNPNQSGYVLSINGNIIFLPSGDLQLRDITKDDIYTINQHKMTPFQSRDIFSTEAPYKILFYFKVYAFDGNPETGEGASMVKVGLVPSDLPDYHLLYPRDTFLNYSHVKTYDMADIQSLKHHTLPKFLTLGLYMHKKNKSAALFSGVTVKHGKIGTVFVTPCFNRTGNISLESLFPEIDYETLEMFLDRYKLLDVLFHYNDQHLPEIYLLVCFYRLRIKLNGPYRVSFKGTHQVISRNTEGKRNIYSIEPPIDPWVGLINEGNVQSQNVQKSNITTCMSDDVIGYFSAKANETLEKYVDKVPYFPTDFDLLAEQQQQQKQQKRKNVAAGRKKPRM